MKPFLSRHIFTPLRDFLNDSRAVGIILIICTVLSMLLANFTNFGYVEFWKLPIHFPDWLKLPHSPDHVINDLLMAVFFFLVGMEIKRELLDGELSNMRKAMLPVAGAIGGMIAPALIFTIFNTGTAFAGGWGIPMATDIAFSLGIAALLGRKVPVSLKIFLMALAIIDDLGAILVIAIFYGGKLQVSYLLCCVLIIAAVYVFHRIRGRAHPAFVLIAGLLLWYCMYNSGIHATVAGVLLAMLIPLKDLPAYEHQLHRFVNFIILPIFALSNTAIIVPANLGSAISSTLSWGIILGLLIGKPAGITLLAWIAVITGLGERPARSTWLQLCGIGLLAGIGFTMSIFITLLAFQDAIAQDIAKIAVLIASVLAIVCGMIVLSIGKPARQL